MSKPLFVVIEGIDRCGKNLQADYLERRLAELKIPVRKYSTPDYNGQSGEAISRYLQGQLHLSSEGRISRHDALARQSMLDLQSLRGGGEDKAGTCRGHVGRVRALVAIGLALRTRGRHRSHLHRGCLLAPARARSAPTTRRRSRQRGLEARSGEPLRGRARPAAVARHGLSGSLVVQIRGVPRVDRRKWQGRTHGRSRSNLGGCSGEEAGSGHFRPMTEIYS